ncbi:MAG: cytidine deaminase [Anaerolineae bacterium]
MTPSTGTSATDHPNSPVPVEGPDVPAPGPEDLTSLIDAALRARRNAYAPYSRYRVGAAVLAALPDGRTRVYEGCNVENAMYGATVCAERVAVWTAVADGARDVRALALVTPGGAAPCGFCRQVLAEFAPPRMPVVIAAADDSVEPKVMTLGELLPQAWGADDLAAANAARS